MYSINKKESLIMKFVKEWSKSSRSNLVNSSPYVMRLICQKERKD